MNVEYTFYHKEVEEEDEIDGKIGRKEEKFIDPL